MYIPIYICMYTYIYIYIYTSTCSHGPRGAPEFLDPGVLHLVLLPFERASDYVDPCY